MKNQLLNGLNALRGRFVEAGLLLAFGTFAGSAFSQTTVTVGTGTSTSSNTPITAYYGYSYSQNIYTASDIIAAGGSLGTISKVRFFYNWGSHENSDVWTIYIGNTTKTSFANNSDWEPVANLTNCFSDTITFPASGWVEVTLTTPFDWNGTSNLVIAVDENRDSYASGSMYWNITGSGADNRSIYYYDDSNNPDPASPPTANGRATSFANAQLVLLPAPDCAGTPAHAAAVASDVSVCPNEVTTLSLDQLYFYSGMTYQWQQNDGSGWADVPAATSSVYTTPQMTASTDFRAIVTCTLSTEADTSDAITVTVNPSPTVVIDQTDVAICGGEPANLTASGADTYLWAPTTLLTPSATSANVNVIPSTTTTYTVTGTDAAGCSATASAKITPVTMVTPTITYAPSENCAAGSPVTMQVTGLPTTITSGGTWEYRFLGADSVTVLQDWSAVDSYTFTPAEDSVYAHFFQVRSTSCPGDYVDSVYTEIAIGFGADVTLTDFNCNNMGGTIALSHPFGQIDIEDQYDNTFSDPGNLSGVTLTGSAGVADGRMVLTPSATGINGYSQIDVPAFSPGLNNAMTVSFLMTADQPINNYGTGGADGIAYSFGDDAIASANGSGHNGKGTKLRLSFDAAGNSSENNNQVGIYLVYGWTAGNAFGPGNSQTLAYSPNTALWKLKTDVPVVLSIDMEGKAMLTVDGTVVFSNIQLPPAYLSADVSGWKHLFSAATGGDAMRQAVSDVSITTSSMGFGITAGNSSTPPTDWQSTLTFDDLAPGQYDIWIARDASGNCLRNIGTYEILNTNPVVDLGNDTTICEGEALTLDAGNPGATYTWSGSNVYTQTLEVSEAGTYLAYVTDAQGCTGIGQINVNVNEAPTATGIYAQGAFPNVSFAVTGAQNADTYDWDFGDGTTVANGPASITHTYTTDGTFTVTVTLTNGCGTQTYTQSITITDVTGIAENAIDGLHVYPNPSTDKVTITVPNSETSTIAVYDMAGALIQAAADFHSAAAIDVSQWQKGIYFLHISNQGKSGVTKLVVQ